MAPIIPAAALIGGILIGVFLPQTWAFAIAAIVFVIAVVFTASRRPA